MLRTANLEILNRPNVQHDAAKIRLKQCGQILIFSSGSSSIFSGSDDEDDRCGGGGGGLKEINKKFIKMPEM